MSKDTLESVDATNGVPVEKDKFFDFTGLRTGVPVNKKLIIAVVAAVAVYFVLSLVPLSQYGERTSSALGFMGAIIVLLTLLPTSLIIPGITLVVLGTLFKFWQWGDVASTLGNSQIYTMLGMMIVAMGAEFTPIGERIALHCLRIFGQRPTRMVVAVGIVTGLLSATCSNIACAILMSGICARLLAAMGEEPGKSKLGKCLMLVVTMASMMGGIALISGSPVGNTVAISFMEGASNGLYSVTYGQWAMVSVPCFIIIAVPMGMVYVWCFKLKNSDVEVLPKSYYEDMLKNLGPIGGSEIRWIITVVVMVVVMATSNASIAYVGMAFALISMLPIIGTVDARKAMKKLPMDILFTVGMAPILGILFSNYGLSDFFADILGPMISGLGPVGFSIASALIMAIMINLFVNAPIAITALVVTVLTSVCIGVGYNPTIILLPTLLMASQMFIMGSNVAMLVNKGYGYWEMKDPIIPGVILNIICVVVFPLIACFIGPLAGIPLHI